MAVMEGCRTISLKWQNGMFAKASNECFGKRIDREIEIGRTARHCARRSRAIGDSDEDA